MKDTNIRKYDARKLRTLDFVAGIIGIQNSRKY